MKLYKITFDYNDSANSLKQITVPTNAKYQLGVKVEKDDTPLEGITLKDGADEIEPRKTDNGFAIFDLESGDDAKADKTFGVKVESSTMISSSSRYMSIIMYVTDLAQAKAMGLDKLALFDPRCLTIEQSANDDDWSNPTKLSHKTGYIDGCFSDEAASNAPRLRVTDVYGSTAALYFAKSIGGKFGWWCNDGSTITDDKIYPNPWGDEIFTSVRIEADKFGVTPMPTNNQYVRIKYNEGIKANFKGVVVNQEEFDVVDVKDEINELSFENEEGEKQTIEAKDIATKEDIPDVQNQVVIKWATLEVYEDSKMSLVIPGKIDDYTKEYLGAPKNMFRFVSQFFTIQRVVFRDGETETAFTVDEDEYWEPTGIHDGYTEVDWLDGIFVLKFNGESISLIEEEQ